MKSANYKPPHGGHPDEVTSQDTQTVRDLVAENRELKILLNRIYIARNITHNPESAAWRALDEWGREPENHN